VLHQQRYQTQVTNTYSTHANSQFTSPTHIHTLSLTHTHTHTHTQTHNTHTSGGSSKSGATLPAQHIPPNNAGVMDPMLGTPAAAAVQDVPASAGPPPTIGRLGGGVERRGAPCVLMTLMSSCSAVTVPDFACRRVSVESRTCVCVCVLLKEECLRRVTYVIACMR